LKFVEAKISTKI